MQHKTDLCLAARGSHPPTHGLTQHGHRRVPYLMANAGVVSFNIIGLQEGEEYD